MSKTKPALHDFISDTEALLLIPPTLSYASFIHKDTVENYDIHHKCNPQFVFEWKGFTSAAKNVKVSTKPLHKKDSFHTYVQYIVTEDNLQSALKYKVFNNLARLTFHHGKFVNPDKKPDIVGRPYQVFVEDDTLLLIIEERTRVDLHVPADTTLAAMYFDGKEEVFGPVCHLFGYMVHNRCKFGVLSTYDQTWFFMRDRDMLYVSPTVTHDHHEPTLYQCYVYALLCARKTPFCSGIDDERLTLSSDLDQLDLRKIRLEEFLGAGITGSVFSGKLDGENVAVKICDISKNPKLEADMLNEVGMYNVLKKLQGDCIPKLVAFGYVHFFFVIVTTFAGSPLADEKLNPQERQDAMDKLGRIHAYGIVHDDLHKSNILIRHSTGNKSIMFIDLAHSGWSSKLNRNEEMAYLKKILDKQVCTFVYTRFNDFLLLIQLYLGIDKKKTARGS